MKAVSQEGHRHALKKTKGEQLHSFQGLEILLVSMKKEWTNVV